MLQGFMCGSFQVSFTEQFTKCKLDGGWNLESGARFTDRKCQWAIAYSATQELYTVTLTVTKQAG